MKNSKGLTTLALSLLLGGVVSYPAIAQTTESRETDSSQSQLKQFSEPPASEEPEPSQLPSEDTEPQSVPSDGMETEGMETDGMETDGMEMSQQAMPGEIVGIVGDTVTVEMEDGTIETIEGVSGPGAETLTTGMTVYVSDGVLYADEMAQTPLVTPEVDAATDQTYPDTTVQETEPLTEDETQYGTETEQYPGQTVQDTAPTTESDTEFGTEDNTDMEMETQETEPVRGLW